MADDKKKPIKLNDEQLMLDASQVADIYHQLTLDLFDQVVDRIKERGSASLDDNPYIWQLEKMNEMGLLNEDNLKLISERSGIAEEQLRHVIQGEGYQIYQDTKQQLIEATGGTGTGASSLIQTNLAAYVNQTMNDIDNLINTTLPKSVIGAYKSIIEEATAKVVTGLATSDKAIADTVMKWAKKGFYGFTDSQGKRWRADTYARQVIKSTAWRVYREVRMAPAEEMGIDTFYYSKKSTAREMCAPLQHQIVTTGVARTEKGERILALSDYGYGSAGGCLGINCRHEITPFVVGANYKPDLGEDVKDLTPEQAIENANAQAKQRALERSIRQSKEFLHVAEKLGNQELIDKYKNKVRIQQGAMRDYLRQHPFLHRDYARERYYYNDDAVQKLYKTIDKRSKKEYSEILRNLGNKAPKSYSDYQALSRSEKDSLRYDNRIVNYFKGDIQEKLSDKQKQQAVEAYFNFKNDGIVFGDHAIARYIERMRRNDGTFTYNYDTVKTAFSLPPNYVSEQNGRLARYYNGILYITEPDTDIVVTMMKRKKLKGFKPL
ncbi:TPA: phage minor capsid protein [Streptococcus pyogenes]|uniref:Phage minor capsid 2 family protein n=1 Tax=Streptococcus anginosus TaxID=1328 RepID=A0A4U9Y5P0_STRAP|nr:phage minor capsid protein [Streptococcus anginosus]HEQ9463610.1 phage minor capsid protein [Streptococcus pyogenes]WOT14455.1 phage minor capsid protein [Streptococcus anginosus]VTS20541.1 phage minor capsid 2 family protein [Streptococcus anginosus]HEQ9486042.1 phage minor capsid protein [Streptococcus pyogenes]HEQ9524372.1 phage minor capsid protein [Streptococcus pyogenes]